MYLFRLILEFLYGIRDSLNIKKVIEFILISPTIKNLFVKTVLITGFLQIGSIIFLNIISNSSIIKSLSHSDIAVFIFSFIYYVFYLYPLFIISMVINSFYYLDMAGEAISLEKNLFRNRGINSPNADVVTRIYNEVINALITVFFLIQSQLIQFVPYFGPFLHIIMQGFLYAFYCFAYKWGTDQNDLYRILTFFEKYFAYFSGFGFVFAVLTKSFSGALASGIYTTFFPIFLLLSVKASPPKELNIQNGEQFMAHVRKLFTRNKQERQTVEYDYIDTFNYESTKEVLKNKIGVFSLPLLGVNLLGSYLENLIQTKAKVKL